MKPAVCGNCGLYSPDPPWNPRGKTERGSCDVTGKPKRVTAVRKACERFMLYERVTKEKL